MQKYLKALSIISLLWVTACMSQETSAPVIRYPQVTLTPSSIPIVTSAPISTSSLGDHFPQLINTPSAYVDLPPVVGDLRLENGCLRLSGVTYMATGSNFLLIWDENYSTRTEQKIVQVIDSITGEVLASVGDYVMVGYGGMTVTSTQKHIPDECNEPYLVVGRFIKKIVKPSLGAHFPQSMEIQGSPWETTLRGELVFENSCLRINTMDGNKDRVSALFIWDLRFSTRTEQGVVQVIDSSTGETLLSTGDYVSVDGQFIESPTWVRLKDPMPEECPGPYFHVGREESIKLIDRP